MSESTTTTTETAPVAKPAAKKARKPKSKAKAAPTITGTQHRVLRAISKKPLTRRQIADACFGGGSKNFVPILQPLVKAKLVREDDMGPEVGVTFEATAAGRKIAAGPAPMRATTAEHQSLPKVGGSFTKTYLGKVVTVKVLADGFQVGSKKYSSLTAAAKGVRGSDMEVNGWAFFGLTK